MSKPSKFVKRVTFEEVFANPGGWLTQKPPRHKAIARAALAPRDPRDPDYSKDGIFVWHNCAGCGDGTRPCREGNPRSCSWPRARND